MDYARYLTEGAGGWLQFEGACGRDGMFSEKYLTVPIGQILSANARSRVLAEFKHPVLSALGSGPGRRPEVDFVVCEDYPHISIAVESKWIGKTRPSDSAILWDLIRLEMLAHTGARCYFVLGGKRTSLDAFFKRPAIAGTEFKPARPMLLKNSNAINRIALVPIQNHRRAILRKLLAPYQNHAFPHYIVTRRSAPFPLDPPVNRYQIYAWEVRSMGNRAIFRPENSAAYRRSIETVSEELVVAEGE